MCYLYIQVIEFEKELSGFRNVAKIAQQFSNLAKLSWTLEIQKRPS